VGFTMSVDLPEPIKRVEMYYNADREPVKKIEDASFKYVTVFDENGEIEEQYQVEIINGIDPELEEATEEFKEEEHPRDEGGQFSTKGSSKKKVDDYIKGKSQEIKPKKEEREQLKKVDNEITNNVKKVIEDLGYGKKIKFVEMQGSYAKNTDLTGRSDLDLFIGFDKSVPRKEFERVGLEIGQRALSKYSPYKRYAEHPFTEAIVGNVEIQIVPAYDISLEDIKNKKLLSATDRTPHQTRFMNKALSSKQKEDVRLLKSFMKENRVYGSDERIKGFSGYSSEVLIHELGSFENTLDFFANFENGKALGTPTEKQATAFTIVDPIDYNRNLVTAFSDQKIARMVKVSREFLETGEIPKPTSDNVDSVGISLKYNERSKDKLFGEINRSITAISNQLALQGYDTKTEDERITSNWNVSIPRVSYNVDKENNQVKIYFGLDKFENKSPTRVRGPPVENERAVKAFRESNPNSDIRTEVIDGEKRLVRYEERKHKTAQDALNHLLTTKLEKVGISKGIIDDIKSNGFSVEDKKEREFENLV
jgi:tRNA nucleotidyltransferase (CCA-adding enzyme)